MLLFRRQLQACEAGCETIEGCLNTMCKQVWYFAYGSNMNLDRLERDRLAPEGVQIKQRILGRLDGWTLAFNKPWLNFKGGGAANIMPSDGGEVYGTLNLIHLDGLEILDRYEGVARNQYTRNQLAIERPATGDRVDAAAYIAVNPTGSLLPPRS